MQTGESNLTSLTWTHLMHCVDTAEFASLLAFHATAIVKQPNPLPTDQLTHYWVESRARLEHWHRELAEYHSIDADLRPFAMQAWWTSKQPLLEEILVTDVLTRVMAAIALAIDQQQQQRENEPVTHSIFVSHLEARNRVLQLVLFGRGSTAAQSLQLNRLRRAVERWIDRLLAILAIMEPTVRRYAVDFDRLDTNIEDLQQEQSCEIRTLSHKLSRSAMRCTLESRTQRKAASPSYNDQVVDCVLAILPIAAFDSLGWLKSSKLGNLTSMSSQDTQPSTNHALHALLSKLPRQHTWPTTARWLI